MVLERPRTPLVMQERPLPRPGPGEVLVEVKACGVCRTDLHVVDGELPDPKLPIIPGHEIVGRIAALGEGVSAHDVDDDDLRPALGALDPGFPGVAGGGDLAGVLFEVVEADPGAAPDQCAFPDFGGVDAQDQRQPPRSGVHAGFEEHPLHAVAGQDAPGSPDDKPA